MIGYFDLGIFYLLIWVTVHVRLRDQDADTAT